MKKLRLKEGWIELTIPQMISINGIFCDGDWVESKDQDERGEVRLIQLADIGVGIFKDKSARFLTQENAARLNCTFLKEGDVLIARMPDPLGRACIFPLTGMYVTVVDVAVIRPGENGVISKWLMYTINSPQIQKQIYQLASGSTRLRISRSNLSRILFPVPPLPEQKRIVAKLDEAFKHLEILKARLERIPELLKKFRQTVLTHAVTGKLTEEWRKGNLVGRDANTLAEEYNSLRNNEYNEYLKRCQIKKTVAKIPPFEVINNNLIPLGWQSITIESAALFIVDCLHSTPSFIKEGAYYCIDTNCIAPFKIYWAKARKLSRESYDERTSRMIPEVGDILFSREGTIGTVVRYKGEYPIALGQRMMMFRFCKFILPEFAEIYLASSYFKCLYGPLILGTSAQHLNIRSIRKLEFILPTEFEQKEIVSRVQLLFEKLELIENEFIIVKEKIDKLPQALLAKAFRGELVEQDQNDKPATELLKVIKEAKGLDGKVKRLMEEEV